ncbi:YmdB family metallophosphoesterase [bacterium]|nr:YmdB family metallophosphoesterase [bacterium]
MKILHIGDVVARHGRRVVQKLLPGLIEEYGIDFVIAQSENMATGNGLTVKAVQELQKAGVDFFTGGNHSFKKPAFDEQFNDASVPVVRPGNYAHDKPGRGHAVIDTPYGKVLIVNVIGNLYNGLEVDNPLQYVDEVLARYEHETFAARIVDFHAELTSEKIALGYYLDGRVTTVVSSHTHVPTADARVLPGGTATISDLGMTGPANEVLGVKKEIIIEVMRTGKMRPFERPEKGPGVLQGLLVDADPTTGKARSVEQVLESIDI